MKDRTRAEIVYGPRNDPSKMHGYRDVRWVENTSCGLRRVGFADEIARDEGRSRCIDHKGWYTSEDNVNDELYRGVVYQLPARQGTSRFVYGYADPINDDCALLCFDFESETMDAALAADRFAGIFAEDAREYDRAWRAGRRCEDITEEIVASRREALALGDELRALRRSAVSAPSTCARIRSDILSLYRSIQRLRKERSELVSTYSRAIGFSDHA